VTERPEALLRFVLTRSHPDTGVRDGLCGAAYDLRDGTKISAADRHALGDLLSWFEANLAVPGRFNKSKSKGHSRRRTAGISWLKPNASQHLAKMRAMAEILERHGHQVSQITASRPGYVIFEDDHQVIAEPFRSEHQ
jgi:hypothetical protein